MTNSKSTKGSLLVSSISLLLCFAMLLGTTFAWFTDSVATANNIITAGNLDVELYYMNDEVSTWTKVDGDTNVFKENTLWEPGHTEVVKLKVVNEGSLALKYQLGVNVASETGSKNVAGDDFKLSDYIKYAIVEGASSYSDSASAATAVDANANKLNVAYDSGVINLEKGTDKIVTVVVYMPETVGNEANYGKGEAVPTINLGINLAATQLNSEKDSFGPDYDEPAELPDVTVYNAADLADAITNAENGDVIALANDISGVNANTAIAVASGVDVTLDLNGHKLAATADKTGNQELFLVKGTMTVKNGSLEIVAQNNQGWNAMATIFDVTAGGVLNLESVTANVSGTDMNFVVHLNNWGEVTLNVNNCDFTSTYVAVRAFNSGHDMNNVTIKNTDFHNGRMFWVHNYTSEGADNSTLNLNIYGNGNTKDNAKPVRFGFSNSVYYDINGTQL